MALPPSSDHAISLDDAAAAIAAHRDSLRALGGPDHTAAAAAGIAYGFHASAFERILGQPGCVAIRMYPALRGGNQSLVLVGVDEEGNDMTNGALADDSWLCPPFCPPGDSPLTRTR